MVFKYALDSDKQNKTKQVKTWLAPSKNPDSFIFLVLRELYLKEDSFGTFKNLHY